MTGLRLGLIARMDTGGLGSQTLELYRHLKPHKTLVVDISQFNHYPQYPERYPDADFSIGFPTHPVVDRFLDDLDVVFTAETPYNFYLLEAARVRGIKTIVQYNYEFLDYFVHPDWNKPDLLLAPTKWHEEEARALAGEMGIRWDHLPMPVNRTVFPFKPRKQARTFLHIIGHPAYEDRNNTNAVLAAIPHVKSDVTFVIRSQAPLDHYTEDYRIKMIVGDTPNYWEIYNNEDVIIMPRKYGGLNLPLNEAMSSGMIPLMLDIPPQNGFLHPDSLIPAEFSKNISPRPVFPIFDCPPQALAAKIDWIANQSDEYVEQLSNFSNTYADSISWETLLPEYERVIRQCLSW